MRKWLNITTQDSDFSADDDEEEEEEEEEEVIQQHHTNHSDTQGYSHSHSLHFSQLLQISIF